MCRAGGHLVGVSGRAFVTFDGESNWIEGAALIAAGTGVDEPGVAGIVSGQAAITDPSATGREFLHLTQLPLVNWQNAVFGADDSTTRQMPRLTSKALDTHGVFIRQEAP